MNKLTIFKQLKSTLEKKWFYTIRSQMLFFFGSIFFIIFMAMQLSEQFGLPFSDLRGEYYDNRCQVFKNISLIADLKKEKLISWMNERKSDATTLSEATIIVSYVNRLKNVLDSNLLQQPDNNQIKTILHNETAFHDLRQYLNLFKKSSGVYKDIVITEAESGIVLASTYHDNTMSINWPGRNLRNKPQADYHKQLVIIKNPKKTGSDLLLIRPLRFRDPKGQMTLIVFLTIYIDLNSIIRPLLHTGEGLGHSGEVVLINLKSEILTSLKHLLSDGSIAIPLEFKIDAVPAKKASQGEEGIIHIEDYRGVPVLAAYRHIKFSSTTAWGMVVKQDVKEIFSQSRTRILSSTILGFISISVMLILTFIVSKNLSYPLHSISVTAKKVMNGDFNARAAVTGSDEIASLATAFNALIEKTQNWHTELAEEVKVRTKDLQEMVYVASHDLQSPLLAMVAYSNKLISNYSGQLDEKGVHFLSRLRNNAERLHKLVMSLLDISRVNTRLNPFINFNANKVIQSIIRDFELRIDELKVEIQLFELPLVYGDQERISTVFRNLISNALNYSAKHIQIGYENNIFFVKDDGIGIPANQLQKIFKSGERLKLVEVDGVGMGLTLCKKIVDKHKGKIWAESKGSGKGSKFNFILPKASKI